MELPCGIEFRVEIYPTLYELEGCEKRRFSPKIGGVDLGINGSVIKVQEFRAEASVHTVELIYRVDVTPIYVFDVGLFHGDVMKGFHSLHTPFYGPLDFAIFNQRT